MQVKDVVRQLDQWAPFAYAEDFDNVGLLVGEPEKEIKQMLVCLDSTPEVVQEAVDLGADLIVAFHPIIFGGLKSLTGRNYVEQAVIKAIKNDIAIVAVHTALDNSPHGVSYKMGEMLQLKGLKVLMTKDKEILKLNTYVPKDYADHVRRALFEAGAGHIGEYKECSFNWQGEGTFKSPQDGNPFVGQRGELHKEPEVCIQVILPKHLKNKTLSALFSAHPYEEVAYEVQLLENENKMLGMGMIGNLEHPMNEQEFLKKVCNTFLLQTLRHSPSLNRDIRKVAVLGGSGSFAISAALGAEADVYISSDLKYHDFFKAEKRILLCDIGHFESEQFTIDLMVSQLKEFFPTFAVQKSEVNTNPVRYFFTNE